MRYGPICGLVCLSFSLATVAIGQTEKYGSPLFSTPAPQTLDRNYGLPTFGMPGAELPQQRTMATRPKPESGQNFFDSEDDDVSVGVPRTRTRGSDVDTPLFTTRDSTMTPANRTAD